MIDFNKVSSILYQARQYYNEIQEKIEKTDEKIKKLESELQKQKEILEAIAKIVYANKKGVNENADNCWCGWKRT